MLMNLLPLFVLLVEFFMKSNNFHENQEIFETKTKKSVKETYGWVLVCCYCCSKLRFFKLLQGCRGLVHITTIIGTLVGRRGRRRRRSRRDCGFRLYVKSLVCIKVKILGQQTKMEVLQSFSSQLFKDLFFINCWIFAMRFLENSGTTQNHHEVAEQSP
jgi:hypothetical protein